MGDGSYGTDGTHRTYGQRENANAFLDFSAMPLLRSPLNPPSMKISLVPFCCAAFAGMNIAAFAADPSPAPASTSASPAASVAPAVKPAPGPRDENSAVTPAIKDPNRHAEFLNRIKEGEIGFLLLGDSIMDGWPRRGEWSWLQFAPYHPADFGISGDRTEHVLWRITNGELDGIHPKVVMIMIGTNNIGQIKTETPEWAANGVKKIVETVRTKLPETKVLLLAVFPRGLKASPERAKVEEINKIIATLDNGKTVRFLDIGKDFLNDQGELTPDIMPDKLHPTAKGYDIWYKAVHPLVDEMMK